MRIEPLALFIGITLAPVSAALAGEYYVDNGDLDVGGRIVAAVLGHGNAPPVGYGGMGAQALFHLSPWVSAELSMDLLGGEQYYDTSGFITHMSGCGRVNFWPESMFDVYLIGGLGWMYHQWSDSVGQVYGQGTGLSVIMGGGAELRLGSLILFSDLRILGVAPLDDPGSEAGQDIYLRTDGPYRYLENDGGPAGEAGAGEGGGGVMFTLGANLAW